MQRKAWDMLGWLIDTRHHQSAATPRQVAIMSETLAFDRKIKTINEKNFRLFHALAKDEVVW